MVLSNVLSHTVRIVRAIMFDADCGEEWWCAAYREKVVLDNLLPRHDWRNAYEPFGDTPRAKPDDLIPFGTAGMCTLKSKLKKNWAPKSEPVFKIGYAEDTPSDTYLLVKTSNKAVITSCLTRTTLPASPTWISYLLP